MSAGEHARPAAAARIHGLRGDPAVRRRLLRRVALLLRERRRATPPPAGCATPLQLFIGAVFAAYFLWCWLRGGQTLAMKAWGIRLVDVTPRRALLRFAPRGSCSCRRCFDRVGAVRPRKAVPARPPRGNASGFGLGWYCTGRSWMQNTHGLSIPSRARTSLSFSWVQQVEAAMKETQAHSDQRQGGRQSAARGGSGRRAVTPLRSSITLYFPVLGPFVRNPGRTIS